MYVCADNAATTSDCSDGVAKISLDLQGQVIDWSPGMEEVSQLRRNAIVGMNFVERLLSEDVRELVSAFLDDTIAGKDVGKMGLCLYSLSGYPLFFDVSFVLQHGAGETQTCVLLNCTQTATPRLTREIEALSTTDLSSFITSDTESDSDDEDDGNNRLEEVAEHDIDGHDIDGASFANVNVEIGLDS
jgi:PAS domain-containing protein